MTTAQSHIAQAKAHIAQAKAHIAPAQDGTLYVSGTQYKVKILILEHIAWGLSAREIQEGHPGLTLGDAHAVLTYFYDNEMAVREELNASLAHSDELRKQFSSNVTRQDLVNRLAAMESAKVRP